MIFRILSVRTISHTFNNAKRFFNSFTIRQNVRFLCNVQTENLLPKSTDFDDTVSRNTLTETVYFRKIMENNPKYPDITFSEEFLKANENSVNELVIFLRNAVNKIPGKNDLDKFELSNLTNFENDTYSLYDMIEIFHLLPIYCKINLIPVKSELMKLAFLMERKVKEVEKNIQNIGLMITLLRLMGNINTPSNVSCHLVFYIFRKYYKLTTVQLLEFFYILLYQKLYNTQESKYKFEEFVVSAMKEMSIDEVALVSFGCFRWRLIAGSLMAEAVSNRVLEEIENLNDLQAATLFKFLQFSGRRRIQENLSKIYEKLVPIIDKFSIMTAVHLISSGTSVNVESRELFQLVWNRANEEFQKLRLKDVERLLLTSLYTNFRVTEDTHFVKLILERFTKENWEILQYPKSFFSLLNYLIMHNIYIEDLITYAMSDQFLEAVKERCGKFKYLELLFIDGSVELERPEYNIKSLTVKSKREIILKTRAVFNTMTSSMRHNCLILDAWKKMYGEESVTFLSPLVHYATHHPILCINSNNEPQKIGNVLDDRKFSSVAAPKDGNLWIVFILLRQQACLSDKITPNLVTEAKLRHFRKAGYIPLTASTFQLSKLTQEDIEEFLRKSVEDRIRDLNN